MSNRRPEMVAVCDACLTEACWQGMVMCQDAYHAGITQVPAAVR